MLMVISKRELQHPPVDGQDIHLATPQHELGLRTILIIFARKSV